MDISQSIHLLGDLLGQIITDLEGPEIFAIEEHIRSLAKARRAGDQTAGERLQTEIAALPDRQARPVAAAFAAYFDLVNLAEEDARVCLLRERENDSHLEPVGESIRAAIATLKQRGVATEQVADLLEALSI